MGFVNVKTVYAEFFEGNYVVLPVIHALLQYLHFFLELNLLLLIPFYRKTFALASFQLVYPGHNLVNLLLQEGRLTFIAHRYFFKLRITENDRIIIACRDARAKRLTIFRFKILSRSHKNISGRVKLQELSRSLLSKMVRHDEHALMAKPQPFALHCRRDHLKSLACSDNMGQQSIRPV